MISFRLYPSLIAILLMAIFSKANGQALTMRDSTRLERAEIKVERAQASHQRHENRILEGDSLIQVGFEINDAAVAKIDSLSLEMQKRMDEYHAKERQLRRQMRNASDAESRTIRNTLRDLERDHRATVREDDAKIRNWLRDATQGARLVERGEKMKKDANKAMRSTQRNLNRAKKEHSDLLNELNLDAAFTVR
ncbi:hypothetical protein [Alkalitalea saponilacus]|uniref:Uncharacterized protein n=1 Tax=Alkalitalea saponilacus TaxID=889453 RepID=A0A1T5B9L8_9BACT|nr:hypothetical protein [Alkalitalea saponilacus]ASB49738.1 hypothetical protein CDL62_11615 [Alkalitalea saponilacus]SKB44004.1 hypothetical protein SAMN03080601_00459 [Alkalitalea saponilacus]